MGRQYIAWSGSCRLPLTCGPRLVTQSRMPHHESSHFLAVQVVIDLEPLYYLMTDDLPLHRLTHTGLGATTVGFSQSSA